MILERSVSSMPCSEYHFANDVWSTDEASTLRDMLSMQLTGLERATGLVVGAGGLPYTLGYLGVSKVVILDKSPQVIENVHSRTSLLEEVGSWDEYRLFFEKMIDNERAQRQFQREFRIAEQSGLRGEFASAKQAAETTAVEGLNGDIIEVLPRLGEKLAAEERIVSILNLTNVGTYLRVANDSSPVAGRRELSRLVQTLPLADDSIIIESGPGILRAKVRTKDEYTARWL